MFYAPFLALGGLLGLPAAAAATCAAVERRHNVRRWREIQATDPGYGSGQPRHSPAQAFIRGDFLTRT